MRPIRRQTQVILAVMLDSTVVSLVDSLVAYATLMKAAIVIVIQFCSLNTKQPVTQVTQF